MRRRAGPANGYSLVELLLVLLAATTIVSVALPVTAGSLDAGRVRHAAGFVAARFRLARQQAAARSATVSLVFDRVGSRWMMRVCGDGNGNGVRRSEIAEGVDRCFEGPHDLEAMFPGVQVAVDGSIRGPSGEPPSSDAIRFGATDMASFSSSGSCTAGSLFLRSAGSAQYAIRVAGVTGRTRILRYNPASRSWDEL